MEKNSKQIIKVLTESPGISGFEKPVREKIVEYLSPLSCEIQTDNLGSLIVSKQRKDDSPKIMMVSHMDEVGFMVTRITDDGFIKFQPIGGWWGQVLLSQKVEILTSTSKILGVIGAKSPHILTTEEMKQPVKISSMFIDIGAASKEEVEKTGIKVGDPITPYSEFEMCTNNKSFMSKALDDRIGCAMIIEIFQELNNYNYPGTIFGVLTVQEEVGLRGAATSVSVVKPDIAIILDVTVATDTPNISDTDVITKTFIGKGPIVGFYDASMIPHIPFRNLVTETALEHNIPFQIEIMREGGTDAGKIHVFCQGVPSIVIGIPVRYIHGHIGIAHMDDYHQAIKLVLALIKKLDVNVMKKLKDEN
ncbi:MAG: peptidase M28 [Firmicutes bacterium HGW-Firmicutes-5]|nr:MAG: peptidase M28 [Firmicutes bacterium HGW-Firmicutes-5]